MNNELGDKYKYNTDCEYARRSVMYLTTSPNVKELNGRVTWQDTSESRRLLMNMNEVFSGSTKFPSPVSSSLVQSDTEILFTFKEMYRFGSPHMHAWSNFGGSEVYYRCNTGIKSERY